MCVLGTLNAIPFDKQIYIYLKGQKLSGDSYAKFQSICHNKNNPTKFKMAAT